MPTWVPMAGRSEDESIPALVLAVFDSAAVEEGFAIGALSAGWEVITGTGRRVLDGRVAGCGVVNGVVDACVVVGCKVVDVGAVEAGLPVMEEDAEDVAAGAKEEVVNSLVVTSDDAAGARAWPVVLAGGGGGSPPELVAGGGSPAPGGKAALSGEGEGVPGGLFPLTDAGEGVSGVPGEGTPSSPSGSGTRIRKPPPMAGPHLRSVCLC